MHTVTDPTGRVFEVPDREDVTIYMVLDALADPTRMDIVRSLADEGDCIIGEFCRFGSKQNIWHHMKALREAGLVESRYEGRTKIINLRRDIVDDLFPGLLDALLKAPLPDAGARFAMETAPVPSPP